MPISLRLPAEIEAQIAGYSLRAGLSKTAVIVRSIEEFLARHTRASSQQIYDEAMLAAERRESRETAARDAKRESAEARAHKLQVREALRSKHAARSASALGALKKARNPARKAT